MNYQQSLNVTDVVARKLQALDSQAQVFRQAILQACPSGSSPKRVKSLQTGRERTVDDLTRALDSLEMALMFARSGLLTQMSSFEADPVFRKGAR